MYSTYVGQPTHIILAHVPATQVLYLSVWDGRQFSKIHSTAISTTSRH